MLKITSSSQPINSAYSKDLFTNYLDFIDHIHDEISDPAQDTVINLRR